MFGAGGKRSVKVGLGVDLLVRINLPNRQIFPVFSLWLSCCIEVQQLRFKRFSTFYRKTVSYLSFFSNECIVYKRWSSKCSANFGKEKAIGKRSLLTQK